MRKLLAGFLIALAVTGAAPADRVITPEGHLPLVVPTGSPVRYKSFDRNSYGAVFTGTFVLTGVYHVAYSPRKDGDGGYTSVYFEPDKAWVARLPYWQPYKQHANQITFDNPDTFVKAAGTKKSKADSPWTDSGRIAIKVTGYKTGVECDWPWFTVHFLSIERAPVLLANSESEDVGC